MLEQLGFHAGVKSSLITETSLLTPSLLPRSEGWAASALASWVDTSSV
jgi:hypothetical protein